MKTKNNQTTKELEYIKKSCFSKEKEINLKEKIFEIILMKSKGRGDNIPSPMQLLIDFKLDEYIENIIDQEKLKINKNVAKGHILDRIIKPYMFEGYISAMFSNSGIECYPSDDKMDLEKKVDLITKYKDNIKYIQVKYTKVESLDKINYLDDLGNFMKNKIIEEQQGYTKEYIFDYNKPIHVIAIEEESQDFMKKRSFFIVDIKSRELINFASFEGLQYVNKYNQCNNDLLFKNIYPEEQSYFGSDEFLF